MLWEFGVTFAGILTLIGFIFGNGKTVLVPALRKTKSLKKERKE